MLNNDFLPGTDAQWTLVPVVNSPREPWQSLRAAVEGYRQWLATVRADADTGLVAALVEACRYAAEAGSPFNLCGLRSLYCRRDRLGPALATLPRERLRSIGRRAVAEGLLARTPCGDLVAPGSV